MKKSNLIVGGLYTLVGAVFLVLAIYITAHTESKLGGIFFGLAGAGIAIGIGYGANDEAGIFDDRCSFFEGLAGHVGQVI